jgi:choline-sulfatase
MADQMRYDAIGSHSPWMKTPNLDLLCKLGVSFSSCYVNSPVCVPSRYSIATGKSPRQLHLTKNLQVDLSPHNSYWTNSVEKAGYKTSVFGKTHLHSHIGDLRKREHLVKSYGFQTIDEIGGPRASCHVGSNMTDLWQKEGYLQAYKDDLQQRFSNKPYIAKPSVLPDNLYADVYVGNQTCEYLEKTFKKEKSDSPWFCWTSFGGPHEPWDAPQQYTDLYSAVDIPNHIESDFLSKTQSIPAHTLLSKRFKRAPKLTQKDIIDLRKNYAGNVSLIDEQIGNIIRVLKQFNQFENTIIVFTSDHGEMNGDHGLLYKSVFFESAIKVPLIVSTPEIRKAKQGGNKNPALVQLSDLGSTILDLAKINSSTIDNANNYGLSFSECLENQTTKHRTCVFSDFDVETMVFDGRHKAVFDKDLKPYLLFDHKHSNNETDNMVSKLSKYTVKRKLTNQLVKYLSRKYSYR